MPEKDGSISIENQQELQQSVMYLEYLKEQIVVLKEQFEILDLAIKEHHQAIETLNDFENLGKNNQILVPIGADSLVFAKVVDHSKVIMNIGSGLAMEEKLETAIEKLNSRIKRIEENKNKIQTTIENLQQQATMLTSSIEEKYSSISKNE